MIALLIHTGKAHTHTHTATERDANLIQYLWENKHKTDKCTNISAAQTAFS